MPRRHLALRVKDAPAGRELRAGFARIREELGLPTEFPADVLAEAEQAAKNPDLPSYDLTDLPFLTIDPPGSTDLDQAMHIERARRTGCTTRSPTSPRSSRPAGPVDAEAHGRGETLYSPDTRTLLHPPAIVEGAASLLPDQNRPALLWTIDLDAEGGRPASTCARPGAAADRLD